MKHMAFGKFAILGAFVVAGCYSYPSENVNNSNFNTVQVDPSFSRVTVGDSDQMLVRLVNDANNGTVTSFVINNTNAGIAVHYNPAYRPYQDAATDTLANVVDKAQQEYYIVGNVPGTYTFTVTPTSVNTSVSTTVTVVVLPADLGAALSVHNITSGDTVTVTAPPGTEFTDSSAVSVGADTVAILSRAADHSSITFSVASTPTNGFSSPVTVTNVEVTSSPTTQLSTVMTTDTLTAPALVPPTLNTNSAHTVGDTVILTLPAFESFSSTSTVTFTSGPISPVAVRTPQQLKVLVGPGDSGSATVTNIRITTATSLGAYTMTSTGAPLSPITALTVTMDKTTANAGDIVTFTAGPREVFSHASAVTFATGPAAPVQSLSADSTVLTAIVGPGIAGKATVSNVGIGIPGDSVLGKFSVTTSTTLTTPALATAPTTVSNTAPNVGETVTVTLGASLRFTGSSQVLIGGVTAGIVSVSADSSTATVLPMAYSTGTVTYKSIVLSYLTTVPLAVAGDKSITVGSTYAGPTIAGANAIATAPTIALTDSQTIAVADNGPAAACVSSLANAGIGGGQCRYYKITLKAGTATTSVKWSDTGADDDFAVALLSADGSTCVAALVDTQPAISGAVGDHTSAPINCSESATVTLTAGTYIVAVTNESYTGSPFPAWIEFTLSQP